MRGKIDVDVKQLLLTLRREEAKRLRKAVYLSPNDILTTNYQKTPSTVIIEAGNGVGKTRSVCDYVCLIQGLQIFNRIYILNYSQSACGNVVRKLLDSDTKVIHYVGIEKHCVNQSLLSKIIKYCGLPSYACYICNYWKDKHRYIYINFINELQDNSIKEIKPKVLYIPSQMCTQPIFRAYTLEPRFEESRYLNLSYTPVVVTPSQLFLTHTVISKLEKYGKRQRKDKKVLLIFDEADVIFYNSLIIKIPELNFTKIDKDLLNQFSPRTIKLVNLIDIFNDVLNLCKDILQQRGYVSRTHVENFYKIKESTKKLLSSFSKRRHQILSYVIDNKIKTNIFRLVNSLEEFIHISEPYYTLQSLEKSSNSYLLYDFDFAIKLLLDNEYPFKHIWKILLSATFPTDEIHKSRFISKKTKRRILGVERKYRSYINVYVAKYEIFKKDIGGLNRNKEIKLVIKNIIDCLTTSVKTYHEYFGEDVKGVVLWFGNKYQYNYFVDTTKKYKVNTVTKKSYSYFTGVVDNEKVIILISYVGSPFARGVDLNKYNISIVVSPLLRPPRNEKYWDILDFSKATADTLQAVMRIVRSPKPSKPKLIIFDNTVVSSFYYQLMPKWFKELVLSSRIKLLN